MAVKYSREVERFSAVSEDGSYRTVIVVWQDFIDAGTLSNPNDVIPGLKTAKTLDGFYCNNEGNDRFRIVQLGRVVVRTA